MDEVKAVASLYFIEGESVRNLAGRIRGLAISLESLGRQGYELYDLPDSIVLHLKKDPTKIAEEIEANHPLYVFVSDISGRAYSVLRRAGIKTWTDLSAHKRSTVTVWRGAGDKVMEELDSEMERRGLKYLEEDKKPRRDQK